MSLFVKQPNQQLNQKIDEQSVQTCPHQSQCNGCQFLGQTLAFQKDFKTQILKESLDRLGLPRAQIEFFSPGDFGLRDRLDFVFEEGRRGLYSIQEKKIVDLKTCGQLSAELMELYRKFREIEWPIQKGSFRLRTGVSGKTGIWLDFSNEDIKNLLASEKELRSALQLGVVEVGQKRKILKDQSGVLKLKDPEFYEWFETCFQGQVHPLLSSVSSFTQPSRKANLMLMQILRDHYQSEKFQKAVEFGAGIGNLSLNFLDQCKELVAVENDPGAVEALKENFERAGQSHKTEIQKKDFQKVDDFDFKNCDFLILNPPRSGVGHFLTPLIEGSQRPKNLFLMSCFLESWEKDSKTLLQSQYQLKRIMIFDQFPQTRHFEILSFWEQA